MGLFNKRQIKELNEKIVKLSNDLEEKGQQIGILQEERELLLQNLEKNSGAKLECVYCFSEINSRDRYCPNCGVRVEKSFVKSINQTSEDVFTYENDKDGILILGLKGAKKSVVIPSKVEDKHVIGIWNDAFRGNKELEEVIFEDGCQYLGKGVFSDCSSLRKVRMPKSLKEIGNEAFSGCIKLQEMIVPENVTVLGAAVFYGCSMLKKLILPSKLPYIPDQLLEDAGIEELYLPDSIQIIGKMAFKGSELRAIELPACLEYIFLGAFAMCQNLSSVVMHSNVKRIDPYAFDRGKAIKIYCAAGSAGEKMKNYMKNASFEQISAIEACSEGPIGYQGAAVVLNDLAVSDEHQMEALIKKLDVSKAETWSWSNQNKFNVIDINKYISSAEAMRLEELLKKPNQDVVLRSFRD